MISFQNFNLFLIVAFLNNSTQIFIFINYISTTNYFISLKIIKYFLYKKDHIDVLYNCYYKGWESAKVW